MNIHAKGQLIHHFWGEYCCDIGLVFETEEHAALALPVLRQLVLTSPTVNACGRQLPPAQWMQGQKSKNMVLVIAGGDDVERVTDQLVGYGADREAIGSIRRSIDSGEPFTVTLQVEDPKQMIMTFSQ